MKYRIGFVTNSSSSGFIIAHKPTNPEELEKVPELIKASFKTILDTYFFYTANTLEDAEKFLLDLLGYENREEALEDEFAAELFNKIKKKVEEGYSISEFMYSYYDETGPALLQALKEEGLAEILESIY